jgi:hypothetical protein
MDMPRVRKQLSRCRACGRLCRENPTPHAYPPARREEILHASQEREPPGRPEEHGLRVSRTTVSAWITKKELSFRLCGLLYWPPIPKMPRPRPWNPIGGWLVCAQKSPRLLDAGLPSAARGGKWWPRRLGIAACQTCQRLWEAIAEGYRQGHCETSFWAAYSAVIPEEQHFPVGSRERRNRSCRAVEQHLAPTSGPFCAHDVLVFPRQC